MVIQLNSFKLGNEKMFADFHGFHLKEIFQQVSKIVKIIKLGLISVGLDCLDYLHLLVNILDFT